MKNFSLLFIFLISISSFGQKEKIEIPPGVVYKYCKPKKYKKAKAFLLKELVENNPTYACMASSCFVGPVLWDRLVKVDSIAEASSTNVELHVDQSTLKARYFMNLAGRKIIWNYLRAEFNGTPIRLRKVNLALAATSQASALSMLEHHPLRGDHWHTVVLPLV